MTFTPTQIRVAAEVAAQRNVVVRLQPDGAMVFEPKAPVPQDDYDLVRMKKK